MLGLRIYTYIYGTPYNCFTIFPPVLLLMKQTFRSIMFDQSVRLTIGWMLTRKKTFCSIKDQGQSNFFLIELYIILCMKFYWIIYHFITEIVYYIMHGYKFRFDHTHMHETLCTVTRFWVAQLFNMEKGGILLNHAVLLWYARADFQIFKN